ncbi:phosphate acetyltransferase [Peptoniphilus sp. GNH]|nr:phosphate acetyltransferase [Clostridiales bacterium KA00134]UHR02467.1 phosphate acetyltransferase [Peptoniphilus sp. GNH]
MGLIEKLTEDLKQKGAKIVFPEGADRRILSACKRLKEEGVIEPIVLGKKAEVEKMAEELKIDLSKLNFRDPETDPEFESLSQAFFERRKGKVTIEEAKEILKNPNYFGTMLVFTEKADGMVSGAVGTTGDTVRPALQIIKTKPGISKVSGSFIMIRGQERYLMADCAINIDPTEDDLAQSAIASKETAKKFGIDPKIAMLSFSTKGSASHPFVDKVVNATKKALEMDPSLVLDGELQFDAAFVESVGAKKAPGSKVAGHANVFIFPSLEAGNIGYKIAQRFGGFEAIGPILQGLNKPVNDLSRGCNEDEVVALAKITAAQAKL